MVSVCSLPVFEKIGEERELVGGKKGNRLGNELGEGKPKGKSAILFFLLYFSELEDEISFTLP